MALTVHWIQAVPPVAPLRNPHRPPTPGKNDTILKLTVRLSNGQKGIMKESSATEMILTPLHVFFRDAEPFPLSAIRDMTLANDATQIEFVVADLLAPPGESRYLVSPDRALGIGQKGATEELFEVFARARSAAPSLEEYLGKRGKSRYVNLGCERCEQNAARVLPLRMYWGIGLWPILSLSLTWSERHFLCDRHLVEKTLLKALQNGVAGLLAFPGCCFSAFYTLGNLRAHRELLPEQTRVLWLGALLTIVPLVAFWWFVFRVFVR